MANIKVSELPTATSFDDDDYTMIVQGNTNKKITKENMYGNYIFSTDEKIIGKWVDDKPIYRKIFTGTANGEHIISIDISTYNVDLIINKEGWLKSVYNNWWTIDNYFPLETNYWTTCYYNNTYFVVETGNNFNYPEYRIILEYTKTTD